jgi:hypothetical protein
MLVQHPTDRQLAALIDGRLEEDEAAPLRAHIDECSRCQLLIGDADGSVGDTTPTDFEAIPIDLPVEERETAPSQGDVWRLAWDDTTALAAIWETTADALAVLPILDTIDADEWCALLDPDITSGLGELAVSVARAMEVPWSVLDARIGELLDLAPIEQLRDALDRGLASVDVQRGAPILSELDDRIPALEQITETMELFASAVWAGDPDTEPAATIGYDVALESGLDVPRALAVGVRGATPTEDEADLIEAATGQRPSPAPIPTALRRTIDQPLRKMVIRARALAAHHSEAIERMQIALAAQPALHAARGTRGAPPDYDLIVDRILDD